MPMFKASYSPVHSSRHSIARGFSLAPSSGLSCIVQPVSGSEVGCYGALVTRTGNAAFSTRNLPNPQIVAPDMKALAAEIIKMWR